MYRSVLALLFASVLLLAYFYVIDPTVQNRQGNDRGCQYQTGVYFTNESARETVKRIAEMELFSRLRIDPGDYQKPRRRLPSRSCIHRRPGVAQRRALLHQQRGPALRPL